MQVSDGTRFGAPCVVIPDSIMDVGGGPVKAWITAANATCRDLSLLPSASNSTTDENDCDDDDYDDDDGDDEMYIDSLSDYEDNTLARQSSFTELHQIVDWVTLGSEYDFGRGDVEDSWECESVFEDNVYFIDDFSDYDEDSERWDTECSLVALDLVDWSAVGDLWLSRQGVPGSAELDCGFPQWQHNDGPPPEFGNTSFE